jgi:hypothetical protein
MGRQASEEGPVVTPSPSPGAFAGDEVRQTPDYFNQTWSASGFGLDVGAVRSEAVSADHRTSVRWHPFIGFSWGTKWGGGVMFSKGPVALPGLYDSFTVGLGGGCGWTEPFNSDGEHAWSSSSGVYVGAGLSVDWLLF